MIEVHNLVYDYPNNRALYGLNFHIEPGTVTALVGPNGAGKTTLMRCLAALSAPFLGHIEINGVNVIEEPRLAHQHVGYLQDLFGLYDDLTVYQCILYHARAQLVDKSICHQRVIETAKQLDISELLENKARNLSRGQRQRLAIAQAIIHHPKVLILDEPASGLDPEARSRLAKLILQLQSQGMTLLVSSHILSELSNYSSHMLILKEGKLVKHCPINHQTGAPLLEINLTHTSPEIMPHLEKHPHISNIHIINEQVIQFEFNGDADAQRLLMKQLIDQDIPIKNFQEIKKSMDSVYFESMDSGEK